MIRGLKFRARSNSRGCARALTNAEAVKGSCTSFVDTFT